MKCLSWKGKKIKTNSKHQCLFSQILIRSYFIITQLLFILHPRPPLFTLRQSSPAKYPLEINADSIWLGEIDLVAQHSVWQRRGNGTEHEIFWKIRLILSWFLSSLTGNTREKFGFILTTSSAQLITITDPGIMVGNHCCDKSRHHMTVSNFLFFFWQRLLSECCSR